MFCEICGKDMIDSESCLYCGHKQKGVVYGGTLGTKKMSEYIEVEYNHTAECMQRFLASGKSNVLINKFAIAGIICFLISLLTVIIIAIASNSMLAMIFVVYVFNSIGLALSIIGLLERKTYKSGGDLSLAGLILNALFCFIFMFLGY